MDNGDTLARPIFDRNGKARYGTSGLTKREHFAGLAMQGLLSNANLSGDSDCADVIRDSMDMADALLAELERTK
ncbi:MAG: hypothetical protein JKY50_12910 [Oleispira sp.]|nr:hypothetical protein [Oleispira sp.]